jgi:ubiquinone/menaquinone biosynthesis C-methylase UbiE
MNAQQVTEGAKYIREVSWGYWRSQILFVATRLGVFDLLARKELSAPEVARTLGLSERGANILLVALTGLELLVKKAERFTASEIAIELLASQSARSMRGAVQHCENLMRCWEELEKCVRTGEPCSVQAKTPEELAKRRGGFMAAMKSNAAVVAEEIYEKGGIAGRRRLLDIGCGPGTFAIEFARRNAALTGTLVDIEEVVSIAATNISDAGITGRLDTRGGDFRQMDLGLARHDLAFVSHVIHMYDSVENERLLARIHRALESSGRVVIHDYLLSEDDTQRTEAAVFAVNMLVGTCGGNCYSDREIIRWLTQAGFVEPHAVPIRWGTQLVIGTKP